MIFSNLNNQVKAILLILGICLLISSCGTSNNDAAVEYLNKAKNEFYNNNDNLALLYIDTIHSKFPKEINIRRQADTLKWNIEIFQIKKSIPYLDSVMQQKQSIVPIMTKPFVFVKDERFQDIGEFEHRLLRTENNTNRCYLKPYTNEHGEFLLKAYYIGKTNTHHTVRASVGDIFKETYKADDANRNSYSDLGIYHETILYNNETVNGLPQFIAENYTEKIKISLIGDNCEPYIFYLNKNEKQVFYETYKLATLLSDIYTLNKQQNSAYLKLEQLKIKLKIND